MDRRGWGCSDRFPPGESPNLDTLAEDLLVVLDSVNALRPRVFAANESGYVALRAVTLYPERFAGLVLFDASPVWTRKDDLPWEYSEEAAAASVRSIERASSWEEWGRAWVRDELPSVADDDRMLAWIAASWNGSIAPGALVSELRWLADVDLRADLSLITVPTLVMHRQGQTTMPVETAHYLVERIPGARFVEIPGADRFAWVGDWEAVTDQIQEFVTGSRERPAPERSLATVLFTDVVGSTVQAVELGDTAWHELLERHNNTLRTVLRHHRGTEVGTSGDGFFATFDSAAQAVACATEMTQQVRDLGMEIRAGVHTGEVERDGDELRGIAVHIGARVMSLAGPSEVLVSSTVKDLSTGSSLTFEDAGEHELKGVPDRWHLYRVVN